MQTIEQTIEKIQALAGENTNWRTLITVDNLFDDPAQLPAHADLIDGLCAFADGLAQSSNELRTLQNSVIEHQRSIARSRTQYRHTAKSFQFEQLIFQSLPQPQETLEQVQERLQVSVFKNNLESAVRRLQETNVRLIQIQEASYDQDLTFIINTLKEAVFIQELPPIRTVRLAFRGNRPQLYIELNPLVRTSIDRDGNETSTKYVFNNMAFHLNISPGQREIDLTWVNGSDYIHPHVSERYSTCWGQADRPIRDALNRGDYSTAVVLISGWARALDPEDTYISVSRFPRAGADLALGWHPELDMCRTLPVVTSIATPATLAA